MSIEEGNKLIAEFMQLPTTGRELYITQIGAVFLGELRYHSSWDWLMPVVEKIENIRFNVRIIRHGSETEYTMCDIYDAANNELAIKSHHVKITAVWQAVIQFIQWYNTKTPAAI